MSGAPQHRLKLGIVGPVPPPNGGMAMQTRQLAELLELEGVCVRLLATNPPYRPAWIERCRGLRALCRLAPYLWRVWQLAPRVEVIHVMANSGWSWQLFAAPVVWLAWLRGTPVVVNYRGGEAPEYLRHAFARVKPTLDRAASIVVPSSYLQQVFADYGISTTVIPNIVNLDRFKPAADNPAPAAAFTLIVTRNLEPIYGIDTAIRAAARLRPAIPQLRLLIAGSGPQRDRLQALAAELQLGDSVCFVGRLGPEEIVALYQQADVMLNPTTVDNMPNSVLEALACGVPVISTDVGGVPHIVRDGETALLVPVGDDRQMADRVLRLYSDRALRQRLVEAGLAEVRKYAWPRVKEQWLEHYRAASAGASA